MSSVRRVFAVLAGVLLLQGYLEVSSLVCALRHGASAMHGESMMAASAGAAVGGADEHGHGSHASCAAPGNTPDSEGVPCGSGPMSPNHCGGMHMGAPAVASIWPVTDEPDGRGSRVAAEPRQRLLSRSSGPDAPPPRA